MKAIALFSGGLDSILAIKIIQEQGIDIVAININIGFESKYDKKNELAKICKNIGVEFLQIDIREQYLNEILFSPKYGYGKYFNPCIDCHANMFRIAKNLLDEVGASFLISGEVVGQRPMSQNKDALNSVSNLGNIEGLLVRPLSAKLLKPTIPEINGWNDRNKLLSISGRSRTQQIELAKKYNLEDYESPAGGCLLTDKNFANKIIKLQERTKSYTQTPFVEFTYVSSLKALKKHTKAIKILKVLIKRELKPSEYARAYYLLGALYQKTEQKNKAKQAYEKSAKSDPKSSWGNIAKDTLELL